MTTDVTLAPTSARATFPTATSLADELRLRVAAYFRSEGSSMTGGARIATKSVVILAWFVTSYVLLVGWATEVWQVLALSVSLAAAIAGIGFNVQHDGSHRSASRSGRFNRLSALTMDLLGVSSYVWNIKHNRLHHTFTNVDGLDDDINSSPFLRLCPMQPRRRWHRYQHVYVWFLYLAFLPKWQLWDDARDLMLGRVGAHQIRRPRRSDLALLLTGKATFLGWALILPLFLHSWVDVLAVYALCGLICGTLIGTIFQLAHCVEEASFRAIPKSGDKMTEPWIEHQLATTVDFARGNRFLTWYLGGLNYQIEHHLFAHVSHVHYPSLAPIVESVCHDHGVPYRSHPSLGSALASHLRHLRRLGRAA